MEVLPGRTPRERIDSECQRRGKAALVEGCIALLRGEAADAELIVALGGPPARWALTGEDGGPDYWLRTWAARGLLWAWDEAALPAITTALDDEAWRVREMALKVIARHRVDEALDDVVRLQDDPVGRVAAAAQRALARLTEGR